VLDGGFAAWTSFGGALESGAPEPGAVASRAVQRDAARGHLDRFIPRVHPGAVVSTAQLEQALSDPKTVLVDARARNRFAGEVEPIDSVAGHIPGAVNHPLSANLDAGNRFLPAAELERRWKQTLAGKQPENLISMCGSGVTACHNLLSLEVAGLTGAKLYGGSWSEWIRDPSRPVARG
jgi:thiosulfate/3-mercaptopyruvate sulfurtransferase